MTKPKQWNYDLSKMPTEGQFEVMRIRKVFRHLPTSQDVIEPSTGRMYVPLAWRPTAAVDGEKTETKS